MKKQQKNTKESSGYSMTIPSVLLENSGIAESKCAELHCLDHSVVILQGKMTAFELIEAIDSLSKLAEFLTVQLSKSCGICEGCDACDEALEHEVKVPGELLDELDIPRNAKLDAYADLDEGLILVGPADYEHDISDVPEDFLAMLVSAGVCVGKLDEHLMNEDIVYGG